LLVRSQYVNDLKGEQLAEYFDPTAFGCPATAGTPEPGCLSPPIWLTVVTPRGYWPIAVASVPGSSQHVEAPPPKAPATFSLDPPQNGRMVSWPSPYNKSHFGLDAP